MGERGAALPPEDPLSSGSLEFGQYEQGRRIEGLAKLAPTGRNFYSADLLGPPFRREG